MGITLQSEALVLDQDRIGVEQTGGVLILDKPEGLTSARAAAKIKKLLTPRKIGHTGTLDPFATGVLVLCLNEATRAADQITKLNKVYKSTLRFGIETDSLDRTGKVTRQSALTFCEKDLIEVLQTFSGACVQTVPRFAAVRVDGHRLYELSRRGIEVERPERNIFIHSIALQSFEWPEAAIEVCCSKGTYIRQLASDIGQKLGSGAHLSALRRTSVGPFTLERAIRMDGGTCAASAAAAIIPLNEALSHLPKALIVDEKFLGRLRNGQLDPEWEKKQRECFRTCSDAVRIVTATNQLAALWWPNSAPSGSRRLRVFPF
ncbi:MAG: tRNA pseudouridine(55) synthase TruB [Syntrophobacteraceae bacterium]|jgi:tRNA pseudouridine55 synthase